MFKSELLFIFRGRFLLLLNGLGRETSTSYGLESVQLSVYIITLNGELQTMNWNVPDRYNLLVQTKI